MTKWIFSILIVIIVVFAFLYYSGEIRRAFCDPNYVFISEFIQSANEIDPAIANETCKSNCYSGYKVTSYKIDKIEVITTGLSTFTEDKQECLSKCKKEYGEKFVNISIDNYGIYVGCACNYKDFRLKCYCDINNCNP
jgi:hypothetical protein